MNTIGLIENGLIPSIYSKSVPCSSDMKLCLVKSKWLGRYCLCVFEFDSTESIATQVERARAAIKNQLKASVFLRSVGAYVVFQCSTIDGFEASDLPIDRTGLHSVIIQGVHLIANNGKHLFNHTKWLDHAFGGTVNIAAQLERLAK